jgi:Flp pilus assembly protein TadG
MPTRRSSAKRGQAGTAALETMVVMSFLFTLIFGFVHLCMFVVTKSMINYAAFTGSRAWMVTGSNVDRDLAARQVMSEVQWWSGGAVANTARVLVQSNQQGPRLVDGRRRRGVRVTYLLPFGYPIFRGGLGLVRGVGFAPTVEKSHDELKEEGDNK